MSVKLETIYSLRDSAKKQLKERFDLTASRALFQISLHIIALGDKKGGYSLTKWLTNQIAAALFTAEMDAETTNKTYKHYLEVLDFTAVEDFESFCLAMDMNLDLEQRFYEPRRGSLREIARELQRLEDGEYEFLSISCPPRVGKTRIATYFLAWTAARHPLESNLATSYSDTITAKFHKDTLALMVDPKYRFSEIFPKVVVCRSYAKIEAIDLNEERSYHTITCRSVGGSVTGVVECTNLLYCDDLVSGQEEALSFDRMQKLWSEFVPNILSRRKMGCKVLCVATRWSIHDPIGQFETIYSGRNDAKFFVKPALDEKDESNFDFSYGLGFSTRYYRDLRETYIKKDDEITWLCLYQNEPVERKGLLFPADSLKYYNGTLPDSTPDAIFAFTDVAWGGGDFLCCPVGYRFGNDIYIHDVVFTNEDKTVTKPAVTACLLRNNVQIGEFEANNGGDEFSEDVDKSVKEKGHRMLIRAKKAPSNVAKLTRIMQHAPDIKSFYFLDINSDKRTAEYNNFMRFLTTFTQTGKNKHDDAPDALAGLANMFFGNAQVAEVKIIKRFW